MSRNIFICVFVLALASTSFAADKLIGTWPDHNDGFRDWGKQSVFIDDPTMNNKYTYVTTGKTNGTKALKMNAGVGWQQNLSIKSYESPYQGNPNQIIQGFLDNKWLAIDVTYVTADWVKTGSNWATIELNVQGTGLSWTGLGRPKMDTGNPGYPGGWDADNFGAINHRTMYWDISIFHDGNFDNKECTATPTSGYFNMIFTTNCGGFSSGGVYYFDKMRFTPEPATMALLGLGGLALIRRKR